MRNLSVGWAKHSKSTRGCFTYSLCLLLPLIGFGGCGGAQPEGEPAVGRVTYEGQPLADGRILFVPEQASAAPAMALIDQGQFALTLPAGAYRVEINASRVDPQQPGLDGLPTYVSYIPARYNLQSELTATIATDGTNSLVFELFAR